MVVQRAHTRLDSIVMTERGGAMKINRGDANKLIKEGGAQNL